MRRKTVYDLSKLISVSSKNSVVDLLVDAFPIEQVKLRFATYGQNSQFIDIYMDFSKFLLIAQDVKSGKFFNDLANSSTGKVIARGGSTSSNRQDGKPEARILNVSMSQNKNLFFNAQTGPGKLNQTGLIMPDGAPDKKIDAMMNIDQCKELFIYGEKAIEAYMPSLVNKLIADYQANRQQTINNQPR